MKKIVYVLLAAAFSLMLVSCQPTPEETVVKGKSLENLIDKATQPAESSAVQGTLAEKMGAQPSYQTELSDPNGKVKIHVNADVEIPAADSVSVDRVERSSITQEQVDALIKHLMKGKEPFSGDAYKITKSEIQQKILEVQAALAEIPSDDKGNGGNPAKGGRFGLEAMLSQLQEQLATAPDTSEKVPCTGKLEPMEQDIYYTAGEKVNALAQSDAGYESLGVYNYEDTGNYVEYTFEKNAFSKNMGYFATKEALEQNEAQGYTLMISSAEIEQIPDATISVDDAKAKAEALIADLGIENMVCYSADKAYGGSDDITLDQSEYINPRKCVWFLRYSRHVKNIPVTYTVWDCMKVEEDNQSTPWAYEDMTFAIDDTGIVGFSWRSPYNMAGTVTENSNLLSFNEITNVFETMSLAVNAWDGLSQGSPNLVGIDITVDHIQFGLTRITEQDKRDSGLLVPAWDFFGTMTQIMEIDGKTKEYDDGPIPILTVNAVDGSIINRSLGY